MSKGEVKPAEQGLFFLHRGDGVHIPGMAHVLQLIQADGDRRHRGAVVQCVPGERLTGKIYRLGGEGDQIADAHQRAHFGARQPGIDEQVFHFHWFAVLRGGQQRSGGWTMIPGSARRPPCTVTGVQGRMRGSTPPTSVKRRNPSGVTRVTIKPIASIWAASRMRGRGSGASPAFEPVQAAHAADCQLVHQRAPGSAITSRTGSSKAESPGSEISCFKKGFSSIWVVPARKGMGLNNLTALRSDRWVPPSEFRWASVYRLAWAAPQWVSGYQ